MNTETPSRPSDCRSRRRTLRSALIGLALAAVVLALAVDLMRALSVWDASHDAKVLPMVFAVAVAVALTGCVMALGFWTLRRGHSGTHAAARSASGRSALARSVRHLSSAVVITDPQLRITSVNEACKRLCACDDADMVGRSFNDFLVTSAFEPKDRSTILEAMRRHGKFAADAHHLSRNGEATCSNIEVQPLFDESSALEGFMVVMNDAKAQRKSISGAHRECARLDAILNGIDAGTYEWDVLTGHTRVNHAAASLLGYRLDEFPLLHDSNWMRLIHTGDRSRWAALMQRHLQGDSDRFECEVRMQHHDGHWVWVLSRCKVSARTADGQAEWVSGAFVDISRRKTEETALREQYERLRNITSTMPAVAYEFELLPDGTRRFNFVNEALFDIFGVKPATAQTDAAAIFDAVLPEDRPAIDTAIRTSAATLHPIMTEIRIRIHGETKWVSVEARPRRLITGSVVWCGLIGDITNRKNSDDRLSEAKVVAERAVLAKSAFLASMSHEIRTPMNGVIGMAELLANTRLDDEQSDAVQTIRESGGALLRIIDDILDLSKIEAGRMSIERTAVPLQALIEGSCEALTRVAAAAEVDLDLFMDPALPEQVCSDPTRLRQVIYNLVGNAIKFSSGRLQTRGHVSVRARRLDGQVPELELSVSDNGIGMSAQTIETLFVPFTQGEVSTARKFGGSGLGLAICRRLTEMLHGRIDVQSQILTGSVFTVRLPLEPLPSPTEAARPLLEGIHCVLVAAGSRRIDDLRSYLEADGADVFVADGAAAALSRAEALHGKVVIVHDNPLYAIDPIMDAKQAHSAAVKFPHLIVTRGSLGPARMVGTGVALVDMIRRAHLSRGVAMLADLDDSQPCPAAPAEQSDACPARTGGAAEAIEPHRRPVILVAEDDLINQKVIGRQLERLGYRAEIALNGKHALRQWREGGPFIALLTDLQMPVMDGYELAMSIRREEGGQTRLPILALTANAMTAESDRVLSAGIDEYLTKPVQLGTLASALERRLKRSPARGRVGDAADTAPAAETAQIASVLDTSALTRLIGHESPGTAHDVLVMYEKSLGKLAAEMAAAFRTSDVACIASITHKLKSSSHAIGAVRMGNLCGELERRALLTPATIAASHSVAFESALEELRQALSAELCVAVDAQ